MEGRIIKQISNDYTVKSDRKYICKARGVFRNKKETPLVGDIVEFDPNKKIIEKRIRTQRGMKDHPKRKSSPATTKPATKATVTALGLKKIGDVTEQPDNASTKGKVAKIIHLIEVEA